MTDDPFYSQNDPTDPIRPPTPSQQGYQDNKLVLRDMQGQQAQPRPERRAYQNPWQQNVDRPPVYSQRQSVPPGQQVPPAWGPGGGSAPTAYPDAPQYPYHQQGQAPGAGGPIPQRPRPRRRGKGCLITTLIVLLLLCIIGGFALITAQRALAFGSAISTQTPLSTQTSYMGTSDRVNLLVMGFGGTGHDGAYLTDSMVVMSLLPQSHHTTLISVPRDLWVQIPANSGQYHKINYTYTYGSNNGANPAAGGDAAAQKVSVITGLNVKYWLTINFTGFRDFINAIGGVDVYIPDSFTANYPANDDPSINPNWIKIHFSKGMQHMDGETAIRYARARYVLDNPAEGSDFARSARQQIMIKAALTKVKSEE